MLRNTAAAIFGFVIALPLILPIPGYESVPPMAQAAALISLPLLFVQLGSDALRPRRGSSLRLVVYGFVVAATVSFATGFVYYGVNTSAAISFINWIAIGSLVVAGQWLLRTPRSLDRMLAVFVGSYTLISLGIVLYVFARFGTQILFSTDRGPFQSSVRTFIPFFPNYYGVAVTMAIMVLYERVLAGARQSKILAQVLVLFVSLLMTFSRGALLACLAGMFVVTVSSGRLRRAIPIFVGSIIVVGTLSFLLPGVRYQFVASFDLGSSQSFGIFERLAFTVEALRLWSEHPLVGIGFHQFVELADPALIAYNAGRDSETISIGSVHNAYTTTLLKGGLIVMAMSLVLFTAVTRRFRAAARSADHDVRRLGITGLGMLAVLVVGGVTLESFRTVLLSGPFWALAGGMDAICMRQLLASPNNALEFTGQ